MTIRLCEKLGLAKSVKVAHLAPAGQPGDARQQTA
jgi:hypothetical protein